MNLVFVAAPAAGARLTWLDVAVLAIFAVGIVLVVLVPFTIDVILSHGTYRAMLAEKTTRPANANGPHGMQGLARATMAFAVIVVIGFALAYILVRRPFADNKTVTSNILVALTTTLASITAFYFGSRLASQAQRDAVQATKAGTTATPAANLSIAIMTPPDGASYDLNQDVLADYTCTPSTGAQITLCKGPVGIGEMIDTSTPGPHEFTVQATDSAGQSTQTTRTYTVREPAVQQQAVQDQTVQDQTVQDQAGIGTGE
jgi:hypothetical protein